MIGTSYANGVPRRVWMFWHQGWDKAPLVAQAARCSWERLSGWPVRALDAGSLAEVLPEEEVRRILSGSPEMETVSDLIRLALLMREGGVWADATTICARPLDDWLPEAMPSGFFAFDAPGPDRPLSNWFLAAKPRHPIIAVWRAAAIGYWTGREQHHNYFWMHGLFRDLLETDPDFREAWSSVPKISARHAFHFGPSNPRLLGPAPADIEQQIADPPAPVFKLTHKGTAIATEDSLFHAICRWALSEPAVPARAG